ncbi:NADH dehydrogenase [ubiquinone] 1 alpha subcomplex subunit 3 isoform X2 [Eptesicus fuscus]|uniref:NADH dehydrogenase [ubiquinone] 1 alpha subcomplex subunit 3 isoform X2 n=1 Tax=Eptesicus fuscus TaxID=29078 RepID=UPI0024041581|nr:NADH dehydrogenase [ubiquinone] 1 alpha subcomplex subunit 3 isoform X2 [Eptesicus fuscus]
MAGRIATFIRDAWAKEPVLVASCAFGSLCSTAAVLNLSYRQGGLRPSENTDIYITIRNSSKISYEVATKLCFCPSSAPTPSTPS